ncbi:MAG: hypothetical protein ACO3V0_09095, partial [Ilumatobacteraceae bacterium]
VSIPISPDDLETAAEGRSWVFLVTSSSGSEPAHVVSLAVGWSGGGVMRLAVGEGRAARNIAAGSSPVAVFPPGGSGERTDYSIIVDGTASLDDGLLTITPTGAMWHRPAR